MIVLDTNVLSETLRQRPEEAVQRWIKAQSASSLFTTTVCEAEIFYGVALLPPGRRRTALAQAVAAIFAEEFFGRILPSTAPPHAPSPRSPRRGGGSDVRLMISTRRPPRSHAAAAPRSQPATSMISPIAASSSSIRGARKAAVDGRRID